MTKVQPRKNQGRTKEQLTGTSKEPAKNAEYYSASMNKIILEREQQMAKFTTAAGIEDLTGKLSKEDRIVMRQKKYRLPNGKIIKCGPKEAFARGTSGITNGVQGQQQRKYRTANGRRFVGRHRVLSTMWVILGTRNCRNDGFVKRTVMQIL